MKTKLTLDRAYDLAYTKYGSELGMFGYLRTRTGNPIYGMFYSWGLGQIITKKELLTSK